MAQNLPVYLDEDFEAPLPLARLEIFLLLAGAMRPSLKDLFQVLPDRWHEAITILARIIVQVLPSMRTASQANAVWTQFLSDARIRALPRKAIAVLNTASVRLAALRLRRNRGLNYLDDANDEAVAWIQRLGAARNISPFEQIAKVPLRVYYDPRAEQYCASSNPLVGEIGWKLQLAEHAFYGALIPDLLFEHEYISHLLPRNHALGQSVREIWLNVGLVSAHGAAQPDPDQEHVNLFLWEKFRAELARFRGGDIRAYGPYNLESKSANAAFHAPDIFWRLTSVILDLEDSEEEALLVEQLLAKMARLDDAKLRSVLSVPWTDMVRFDQTVSAAK